MAHNTLNWSHQTVFFVEGQRGLGLYLVSPRGDLPLQRACRSKDVIMGVVPGIWEPKVQGLASLDSNKSLETKDASMLCCGEPLPNRIYLSARKGGFHTCVNRKLHPNCWAAGLANVGTSNKPVFERKVCPRQHFRLPWSNWSSSKGLKGSKKLPSYLNISVFYQLKCHRDSRTPAGGPEEHRSPPDLLPHLLVSCGWNFFIHSWSGNCTKPWLTADGTLTIQLT